MQQHKVARPTWRVILRELEDTRRVRSGQENEILFALYLRFIEVGFST